MTNTGLNVQTTSSVNSNTIAKNCKQSKIKVPYRQRGGSIAGDNILINGEVVDKTYVPCINLFGEDHYIMDSHQGLVSIWDLKSHLPFMDEKLFDQIKSDTAINGMTDPIMYFVTPEHQKIVLDGHASLTVAIELRLTNFPTQEITESFCSIDEVKLWIIKHQFQRQNLSNQQKVRLAYMSKETIERMAKLNISRAANGDGVDQPIDTNHEIAKLAGVGKSTVTRFAYVMNNAPQDIIEKLMNDKITIGTAYKLINIGERSPASTVKIISSIEDGNEMMKSGEIEAIMIITSTKQIELLDKKKQSKIGFYITLEQKLEPLEKSIEMTNAA